MTVSESTASRTKSRPAGFAVRSPTPVARWEKVTIVVLLLSTAFLYLWKLDQNGWANAFYSAAVQSGEHDFTAFFFGSSDWGNSITVDKPPLSLWVMGLSVRVFGLNSWGLLVPQVIITLTSTLLIFVLMRRYFPAAAALIAAAVFAYTPITVLLARYNNPDPLMVLLMIAALYTGIRATETGKLKPLILAGGLLALGFLTKQLQAFLVLPAIAIVFLLFAQLPRRKKFLGLALAGCVMAAGSLAWPLAVDLTPAQSRPFVGGSTGNSMIELTLGYNGIDRVVQHADDPSLSLIPQEFRGMGTDAGFFRLINLNYGQEIGWLLMPALLSCMAITWAVATRRFERNEAILSSAAVLWFVTTYLVLSFMSQGFHSYYSSSLAPPLALCVGIGARLLLSGAKTALGRILTTAAVIASFIFANAMWKIGEVYPEWLGTAVLSAGLLLAAASAVRPPWPWLGRSTVAVTIGALLIGPLFCSLLTAGSPQSGSNPLSGGISRNPNTLSRFLDGVKKQEPAWAYGIAIGNSPGQAILEKLQNAPSRCTWAAATYPSQTAARFQLASNRPIMPLGGFAAVDPSPTLNKFRDWVAAGQICYLVEQPEQLKVPGNSQELTAIQNWVAATFHSDVTDGTTVYDLGKPLKSSH
ncbi:4-amino-4-deoxy-L-arabinose transferase-like glycosyltransferase [Arthrobacter bambusae]|nr:4-amino-4-deoxy-L-arabinose transferase-like glycosyltransferase [Arthrobacter bambusae]MDQ0236418.1 4-amino-4-deoxy-L-arabinose transferase-like glycosyltransferase [Arthrobacter bambusae]